MPHWYSYSCHSRARALGPADLMVSLDFCFTLTSSLIFMLDTTTFISKTLANEVRRWSETLNTLISGTVPIRQCKTTAVKSEDEQLGKSEGKNQRYKWDCNSSYSEMIVAVVGMWIEYVQGNEWGPYWTSLT